MRLPRPTAVALLLAFSVGSEAHAEEASAVVDRAVVLTQNLIGRIRKDFFEPTILMQKPPLLEIERKIEVVVTRELRPGATAFIDSDKKYIYYNVGTTMAILIYADYAAVRMIAGDIINNKCREYLRYLGDALKGSGDATPEEFYESIVMPANFCGVSGKIDELSLKEAREKISIETLVPVVTLMLGHEVGHHLLGHLPPKKVPSKKAREIEGDADRFGSVLAANKIIRAPASVIFSILAAARRGHPFNPDRRHDTAECRFVFFLKDDQRIHGELIGSTIINNLKNRKDIEEELVRVIKILREKGIDQEYGHQCDILN